MSNSVCHDDLGLYDFMMLDSASQWSKLITKGNLLVKINELDSIMRLYRVNRFYVELQSELVTDNFKKITIFKTGKKLEKYLDGVVLNNPLN